MTTTPTLRAAVLPPLPVVVWEKNKVLDEFHVMRAGTKLPSGEYELVLRSALADHSLETAAKRIFEVMGHDHQVEWDDCTSAQKEFYVCVAKAALGVAHG